jgi:hypothetical protein
MHYNFCRIHKTLRCTPSMEAGLTDHVWTIEEMLGMRIPGQGGHDSEIDPVSIPKLIRSRFRDEVGQGFRF